MGAHVRPSTIFPKEMITMSPWNKDHQRVEADVYELEVIGRIPHDVHGALFRVQPDTQFPPLHDDDVPLNGDGNVSAFYFRNGHVDFKSRYVRTPKFLLERKERQALFGKYRNRYTDDPRVRDVITRTTANTHVIFHAGILYAIKEDGLPWALNPRTLDTLGLHNYRGTLTSPTHTAHPKPDAETGELIGYGYEAKGDSTKDICLFTVGKEGLVKEEVWFEQPWASSIHDFWVTKSWVVFPINRMTAAPVEEQKKGAEHFYYDEEADHQLIGVVPRKGATAADVKWFKAMKGCFSHTINGYEDEQGNIVLDCSVWTHFLFPFFPNSKGVKFADNPQELRAPVYRFRFDPKGDTEKTIIPEKTLIPGVNEFGRIDDRATGKPYKRFWALNADPEKSRHSHTTAAQAGFNTLICYDVETGKQEEYSHGPDTTFQEPCFVPRHAGADIDDGYIVILVDLYKTQRNHLLFLDAKNISKGPIGEVILPLKLLDGLHGSWVDGADVDSALEVLPQ
jgi:carotenoid cleavage dioxygenase